MILFYVNFTYIIKILSVFIIYMKFLKELMRPKKHLELILTIITIVYILFDFKTPVQLVDIIQSLFGRIAFIVLAIYSVTHFNPILAVLIIYALYELYNRTTEVYHQALIPSDQCKFENLEAEKPFENTLEENIINNSKPPSYGSPDPSIDFEPSMNYNGNASPI